MNIIKELAQIKAEGIADGIEVDDSMAYDMAESLMMDNEFVAAAKRQWPGKSNQILREIVAGYL